MKFLQVSCVKCSTGKGSYYRRVKLFCCGYSRFGTFLTEEVRFGTSSDQVNKINSNLLILLTWSEEVLSTETAVTATE